MNCEVCGQQLRSRNTIGFCRKHRGRSPKRRQYETQWQEAHREQYQAAKNKWVRNNPKYYKEYREKDLSKKIAHSLRVRLRRAVKFGSAIKYLGCSVSDFVSMLEQKFSPGMTWTNYGKWHIDHIQPLSSFNLTDLAQLAKACHHSNLQPLWAADNASKNDKLDYIPTSALQAFKKSA